MKRILTVVLAVALCVGLATTALANGDANTTVTVNVNVTGGTAGGGGGSGSGSGGSGSGGSGSGSGSGGTTEVAIKKAQKQINNFALEDIIPMLDRELEGTGWSRVGEAKIIYSRTGRVIVGDFESGRFSFRKWTGPAIPMKFVNGAGLEKTAYLNVFTRQGCNAKHRNYSALFSSNFDTSSGNYSPNWALGGRYTKDSTPAAAIKAFVEWLTSQEPAS